MSSNSISRINYVHVGKHGTFHPDTNPAYNSTPDEIDALFNYLKENNKSKLLLYFHGGLVPAKDGLETAERIIRYSTNGSDSHTFCFVWETGWLKTVTDNLATISNSEFFKNILVKILKVTGPKLGIEVSNYFDGAKGFEQLTKKEIEEELKKEAPFENYQINEGAKSATILAAESEMDTFNADILEQEVKAELELEIESDFELQEIISSAISIEEEKILDSQYTHTTAEQSKGFDTTIALLSGTTRIAVRVIKRYLKKRNHDFYPTVVEETMRELYVSELGNWLWGNMKQKAADMWNQSKFESDYFQWPVGSYFIKKLNEYQEETGIKLTIDLVGHSAGSIVICELLKMISANTYDIKFRNIIFMAPACRIDLFENTVLKNKSLFNSFRCFTMSDEFEKKDRLFSFVYPRSLLYLISGILEYESDDLILGLQRHTIGNYPYDDELTLRVSNFLKEKGHIVYSVTNNDAMEGLRSGAVKHGGFDDDEESTLDSIIYIIKQ
jgi:hypothetical protein